MTYISQNVNVLVLEDDRRSHQPLVEILSDQGFNVFPSWTAKEASSIARRPNLKLDVAYLDKGAIFETTLPDHLSHREGITVAHEVHFNHPRCRNLLITGEMRYPTDLAESLADVVWGYLPKPINLDVLVGIIAKGSLNDDEIGQPMSIIG